eukprot:gnl/TRDRNA2_/TRDRNA2_192764_c0_seq1.p1 gnl/TRDRNA2_/TRDRNA2_192764_c0~~gnl/TRDRNA2_/TRDRNA2_192764_c0_seq1.p1  ORF type:complete len:198 (+),score=35.65 gnl/TRDRNA2_/TRDRNA2_192764_c0_seq1:109-702(+)
MQLLLVLIGAACTAHVRAVVGIPRIQRIRGWRVDDQPIVDDLPHTAVAVSSGELHGQMQSMLIQPATSDFSSASAQHMTPTLKTIFGYGGMLFLRMGGFLVEPTGTFMGFSREDTQKEEEDSAAAAGKPGDGKDAKKSKSNNRTEPSWMGLPKIFWVLVAVVAAMALYLCSVPIILQAAKRKRRGSHDEYPEIALDD